LGSPFLFVLHKRSDLDGMFLGITQLWYKNLKDTNSTKAIKSYLRFAEKKYMQSVQNNNDLYFGIAKNSFKELYNALSKTKD
jgi:hypothetical protein